MGKWSSVFFLLLTANFAVMSAEKNVNPLAVDPVVQGNTEFAFALYSQLQEKEENLLFSPFNISTALVMTYAGAKGQTALEMAQSLHFSDDREQLYAKFLQLNKGLTTAVKEEKQNPTSLSLANSLWIQEGSSLLPSFLHTMEHYFSGEVQEVDFLKDVNKTRMRINDWITNKTQGKIKEILKLGDLNSSSRLVIVSAIYLKSHWRETFDPKLTKQDLFFLNLRSSTEAEFMTRTGSFAIVDKENFSLIELPYASQAQGPQLSMLILLPYSMEGLPDIEKTLTAEQFYELLSQMEMREGEVMIPKFNLTESVDLNEILKKMGMELAFSTRADFSGMTAGGNLAIDKVKHQAYLNVDEQGTEAAAATSVTMRLTSVLKPAPKFIFKANHPFLFCILEKNSGTVLFLGRYSIPVPPQAYPK